VAPRRPRSPRERARGSASRSRSRPLRRRRWYPQATDGESEATHKGSVARVASGPGHESRRRPSMRWQASLEGGNQFGAGRGAEHGRGGTKKLRVRWSATEGCQLWECRVVAREDRAGRRSQASGARAAAGGRGELRGAMSVTMGATGWWRGGALRPVLAFAPPPPPPLPGPLLAALPPPPRPHAASPPPPPRLHQLLPPLLSTARRRPCHHEGRTRASPRRRAREWEGRLG